ncbi:hypothetical protein BJY04DRAFT_213754 [Aspergillus karnatakaensis]|uniref:uncharacterized protein n=1 Tax=Aspergillus karnatakaensis TaxID=1810916 RepID=UPI003CCDBAA2
MPRDTETGSYMADSRTLTADRSVSSTTLRSDQPSKTAFANQIPVAIDGGSGRTLRKPAGSIIALVFEIFLCVVALCFVALGIVALCIKNRPTGDDLGAAMEQAMKLGPTIYPILFAALLSRSLKSIGRYCAQQSVRMSTLWALMNTNATADPILHLTSMPASILVWGLLVLWAMSPLGGQSTIRLLYRANTTDITHRELRYWDSGPLGNMFFYSGIMVGNDGSWPLSMRDIYSASLMQSINTKAGPLDQWGNVKIPRLEAGNSSQASPDGWMPVHTNSTVESYTSLFGIPIVGISETKQQGDVNFTVEMTYVGLSTPSTFQRKTITDQNYGMTVECVDCYEYVGQSGYEIRAQRFMGLPLVEREGVNPNTQNYTRPRTLRFNSTVKVYTTVTTCQVTQRTVEALIECTNGSCAATKVRPSTTDHRPKEYTSFDHWAWVVLAMLSGASSQEPAREVIWGTAPFGLFLNNSHAFPMSTGLDGSAADVNISAIDPASFSTRASILLNTALQAFMAPTGFAGNLPANYTLYGPPHTPSTGLQTVATEAEYTSHNYTAWYPPAVIGQLVSDLAPFIGASTNATLARYTEVYRPDYAWASILIVSSVFLFVAGIAGISVRFQTIAPNMFDPVVGLTYGNPYLSSAGREDNPLDADERANMLREKKVMLGEVDDYRGVKAVFGEAGYVQPLRLGVPYH